MKSMSTLYLIIIFAGLTMGQICNKPQPTPPPPLIPDAENPTGDALPKATITLAEQQFVVELSYTNASREKGLMHRKEIPANTGMLFIHDKEQELSYWMKNCLIDMDILFIKADGTITAIHTMTVLPDPDIPDWEIPGYPSNGAVKYALEIGAGMAKKLGFKKGAKIEFPEKIKKITAEPDIIR